jgi:GDSL-like Lipase/Acylhydrolase family
MVAIPLIQVILIEVFFRCVIPASEIPNAYSDPTYGVLQYDANGRREGTYTIGNFAQQRGKWRINNYGWNSEIDYRPNTQHDRAKPLIAIIGDSYVEAFQVDVGKSMPDALRALVGKKYEVYSFGVSGAPLSQYLQMSRYVNHHFEPDIIVFNIIHNDFDASVETLVKDPYSLQITPHDGTFLEIPPRLYEPSTIRRILGRSAFIRYLLINLKLDTNIGDVISRLVHKNGRGFNANVDPQTIAANRELIEKATYFLVQRIRDENVGKKIIFLMDAPRQDIYAGTLDHSSVFWMNEILKNACLRSNTTFIDLTGPFNEKFAKDHIKFNSDYDAHWNEVGHRTAAQVLYSALD